MIKHKNFRIAIMIAGALAASGCGVFKKGKASSTPVLGKRIPVLASEGDVEVDPAQPLVTGGSLAVESRLHVKLQAPGQSAGQAMEQIFEDTGTVAFSRER